MARKKNKRQLDEDVFEVERLLNQRIINQRTEYLVKWVGYPDENNTWEPEDNIYDHSLISNFNRFLEKQFARRSKSGDIDSDDGNTEEKKKKVDKAERRAKRKKSKLRQQTNSSSGDNKPDSSQSSRKKSKIIEVSSKKDKKSKIATKPSTCVSSSKSHKDKDHGHKRKHRSDRHGKDGHTSSKLSKDGPCSSTTDKKIKKKKHDKQ